MAISYVQLYFSYLEPLGNLTDEQCGRVIRAILQYGSTGALPQLDGVEAVAFSFLRSNFDRDKVSYDARSTINRRNGLKGGAPKGNRNAKKQPKQPKTTETTQEEEEEEEEEEEDEDEEEESSSKDDSIGPADAGTTTTVPFKDFRNDFGQENGFLKGAITDIAQEVGEPLLLKVLQTCREAGGNSWGYVLKALQECKAKGTTLEEYEQTHRIGYRSTVVDRPEPSGHDILQRGRKALKLKRED